MILLHPFAPHVPVERRGATEQALSELVPVLGWDVRHVAMPADEPERYGRSLAELWGLDDLAVCEHDVVPTAEALRGLEQCPRPLCAVAYLLHPPSTGLPAPVMAHRVFTPGPNPWRWVTPEDQWADLVALGLIRVRKEVGWAVAPRWEPAPWAGLDGRMSVYLAQLGLRWHVHWPVVEHRHGT